MGIIRIPLVLSSNVWPFKGGPNLQCLLCNESVALCKDGVGKLVKHLETVCVFFNNLRECYIIFFWYRFMSYLIDVMFQL